MRRTPFEVADKILDLAERWVVDAYHAGYNDDYNERDVLPDQQDRLKLEAELRAWLQEGE